MPGHVVVWHASCLFSALLQFSWSIYLLCSLLDLYCTLEVDSYGYFVSKAKTRVFRDTAEPQWNEVSQPRLFLLLRNAAFWSHKYLILLFMSLCLWTGVWDWAGGLPVPADPVLREMLRQKHAQQGRQRDRGQDHGKRASAGKRAATQREVTVSSWGRFPTCDSF